MSENVKNEDMKKWLEEFSESMHRGIHLKMEEDIEEELLIKQIGHDSPVLKMQCTTMLEDGQPIYYVECYYIGEKYFFSALLPR